LIIHIKILQYTKVDLAKQILMTIVGKNAEKFSGGAQFSYSGLEIPLNRTVCREAD